MTGSSAQAFEAALRTARDAHPDLPVPLDGFTQYVAERWPPADRDAADLDAARLADLYLAYACVMNVTGAARRFESRFLDDVRRGLRGSDERAQEELIADVFQRLLVGTRDRPPRVASYAGHGPLAHFVCVVAGRRRIDHLRARSIPAESFVSGAAAAAYGDPESALLRASSSDLVRGALERAAASLEPRDRNLLRYIYVHQLRPKNVAGIYRVSAATLKRRLADVRARLGEEVRAHLRDGLGLSERQVERELQELDSAWRVTLSRILA